MSRLQATIQHDIDPRSRERGAVYFARGRVVDLKRVEARASEAIYEAVVRGSGGKHYTQRLLIASKQGGWTLVNSACACPVRINCKHVAAALLAIEGAGYLEEGPNAGPRAMPVDEPPPSDAPITGEAWLDAITRGVAAEADAAVEAEGSARASPFAYVLASSPGYAPPGPMSQVSLWICKQDRRRKKDDPRVRQPIGSLGDWGKLYRSQADQAILRLLEGAVPGRDTFSVGGMYGAPTYDAERVLDDQALTPIVWALVDSGRCRWEAGQMPLRRGDDRQATLAWQVREKGRLQLALTARGGEIFLGTSVPLYLDLNTGQVGYVRTLVPALLMRQLHAAPAMTLAEAKAFYVKVPDALRQAVPEPRAPERREVRHPLRPKLMLRLETASASHGVGVAVHIAATLSFVYGELEASLADTPAQEVSRADVGQGSIIFCARDHQAEQRALALASEVGVQPGSDGACVLGPANNMQQVLHVEDTQLRPLREAGWELGGLSVLDDQVRIVHASTPIAAVARDSGIGQHAFDLELGIDVEGKRHDLVALLGAGLESPDSGLDLDDLDALPNTVYLPTDDGKIVAMAKQRILNLLDIIRELLAQKGQLGLPQAVALSALLDTGDLTLRGHSTALNIVQRLTKFDGIESVAAPKQLRAELRPYQQFGMSWLLFLRKYGLGGILADDMGLGKTIQIIAYVLRCKQKKELTRPVLVVAPTSLMGNWQAELRKFAPSLAHALYYGPNRQNLALTAQDVVLTTYGVLWRDIDVLGDMIFDTVVLDESQTIKSARSGAHRAVRAMKAAHHICLSGTPLQNNLEELWAQFAFCLPSLLGTHRTFQQSFAKPIGARTSAPVQTLLHQRIKPFVLRRKKSDVLAELPTKTQVIERIVLGRRQADLYESVRSTMNKKVLEAVHRRGMAKSHITILAALTKLKQVCCDPRLLKLDGRLSKVGSAKLDRLMTLLQELTAQGRTTLVFSQYTSMLALIAQALDAVGTQYLVLTGQTGNRGAIVEAFQAGQAPIMLISLKAGGVGLNLTAADTVVHYDLWWNPASENQATDRAHRLGQQKPVHVYKLVVQGSLEETILGMQQDKQALADQVLDEGAMTRSLDISDIEQIFAPIPKEAEPD